MRQPDSEFLARLKSEFGISIDWLLTGEGAMHAGPERQSAEPPPRGRTGVDTELLARVGEAVSDLLRAEKAKFSARRHAIETAEIYNDLVAAYDTREERLVGLKGAIERLRRDLRATPDAGERGGTLAS